MFNFTQAFQGFKIGLRLGAGQHQARRLSLADQRGVIRVVAPDGEVVIPIFECETLASVVAPTTECPSAVAWLSPASCQTSSYSVYVNRAMLALPMETQLSAYFHEIGHILNFDLVGDNGTILVDQEREYAADAYVVSQGRGADLAQLLLHMSTFVKGGTARIIASTCSTHSFPTTSSLT